MIRRILLVEDNKTKAEAIKAILARQKPDVETDHQPDITSSYSLLRSSWKTWDLIILDMTFSVSGGFGRPDSKQALAGIELMQFMASEGIGTPVIVATQHDSFGDVDGVHITSIDELDECLTEAFDFYRGTVQVDLASSAWIDELSVLLEECDG